MNIIVSASKTVLREKRYLLLFFLLSPLVFFVFILVPVFIIPGNDIAFQISLFTTRDYALLSVLAPLISLVAVMQVFIFKRNKSIKDNLKSAGVGAAGGYSGIVATVFATASCSSCVAAILGFLGTGPVFFAIENRWLFVSLAIGFMAVSLYLTAQRVQKTCAVC